MLCMKAVYAIPDRHIRYAATKAFFGTKMAEGSSMQSHGVKMFSLIEKLEDLKVGLENDTYIDVILQSLPSSYDPFIVNYNMNGLEKSIRESLPDTACHSSMQASRSWNTRFDETIRGYDFIKNDYGPCIYQKISGSSVAYLVLYVDDILLIGNDVKMLGNIKAWLSTQFSMKDIGEASYGIKIYRDRSRRMLGLTQSSYIEMLNGGVVAWKSSKQDTTADSTTEAEYIAASEAAKEAVWMKNYIQELGVVPSIAGPMVIFCDNNGAIAQAKEPRSHHRSKHILRRYHLLR
ncbi:UNVERIFIED_CONTAM: Retrovirus-related Pol polyprotein from transposon TNT 1-94 [Sesamum radiatum]|uniref:Retrovirus-related Pol polyprotein from transposon TNT 1-94 n=1 Tax=Sesamum radiatum TaxID=300843 RepID=A0AAW2TIK4_SESRA